MTAIADLIMRLVVAGAGPVEAASVVAEAYALGVGRQSADSRQTNADKRRESDKLAKREKRAKARLFEQKASPLAASARTDLSAICPPTSADKSESAPLSILPSLTESQRGIQEVSEEKKKEELNTEPREKRTRGARLPDDWQPSDVDRKYAADRGMRLIEIEIEATKFLNYWTNRTDKQACKPRWDRAWQNWILNVRGGSKNGQAHPNGLSRALAGLRDHVGDLDRGEEGRGPPPRLLSHG